jgi:mono/diheme cytochrome c family protein
MRISTSSLITRALAAAATVVNTAASALPPAQIAASYSALASAPADPARGERFFATVHGREWRCASCHGVLPTQPGRHAATGREIGALAPAFHPGRLTDPAKVEKWFRRNCNDVVGRECTAAEKADVLAWLINLKP